MGDMGVKASYKGQQIMEERSRKNIQSHKYDRHLEINRHTTDEKYLTYFVSWYIGTNILNQAPQAKYCYVNIAQDQSHEFGLTLYIFK